MTSARLENLSVAVIGYGSIGRRHCQNLSQLGVGRRIVVRRREAVNPAFMPPDDAVVVHSVAESITAGVDLAIVCNPTSLHVSTAREYVAARVPVLIEKPLASNVTEAERFVEDAQRGVVAAGVAYCLRYHPAYATAHEYVREGKLGAIERSRAWFESYLPEWHPWEDYRQSYAVRAELGGGVLPTLDHEIDFIQWCFGTPQRCSGKSWRNGTLDVDVDDEAHLAMDYGGHVAEIDLSICRRERRRGFELVGSQATLSFSFEQPLLRLVARDGTAETIWHDPGYDLNEMYCAMLADVLDAVAGGRPMPVPLQAGLDALRVADAVLSSPRTRASC